MKTKIAAPTEQHLKYRKALTDTLDKFKHEMSAEDMLAVSAHLVGQLVAMQDQRKLTSAQVMELVANNIESGNRSVIETLSKAGGLAQ